MEGALAWNFLWRLAALIFFLVFIGMLARKTNIAKYVVY